MGEREVYLATSQSDAGAVSMRGHIFVSRTGGDVRGRRNQCCSVENRRSETWSYIREDTTDLGAANGFIYDTVSHRQVNLGRLRQRVKLLGNSGWFPIALFRLFEPVGMLSQIPPTTVIGCRHEAICPTLPQKKRISRPRRTRFGSLKLLRQELV